LFFERFVKSAYSAEYRGTVKEDTYWIKTRINNQTGEDFITDSSEVYKFFVLLSIDKMTMQLIIRNLMTQTAASVTMTSAQTAAVNRLRLNFFEGF